MRLRILTLTFTFSLLAYSHPGYTTMLVAQPIQPTLIRELAGRTEPFANGSPDDSVVFPEQRFRPEPAQREQYARRVTTGFAMMSERRVVIAGLARNIAAVLPRTVARMERLGTQFAEYQVVIYENDSTDDTLQRLRDWQQRNPRITVLSENRDDPVNLPIRCLDRASRMAYYRNQYVRHIIDRHADCDEVIVVDTDIEGGFSLEGIANTYGQTNWDFVGANGLILRRQGWQPNHFLHYDAWAFRRDNLYQPLVTKEVNHMHWQRGDDLIPVGSCFGGLGIYRREAFWAGIYEGGDCEHVGFHRSMRAAGFGRQFLNPSLIALYGRRRRKFDGLVRALQGFTACCGLGKAPEWC